MSNLSRKKGTDAESSVTKFAQDNGYPWADRLPMSGSKDTGDISLLPGRAVILEVKNHRGSPGAGQPTPGILAKWMAETAAEVENAGADHGVLVVKRSRCTDAGLWFAYVPQATFVDLLGAALAPSPDAWVCMSLASVLVLLRCAGYGEPMSRAVA